MIPSGPKYSKYKTELDKLNVEEVVSQFDYLPEYGEIYWKRTNRLAGAQRSPKQGRILYKGASFPSSVIAWIVKTGEIPPLNASSITFLDGDRSNLKWDNLSLTKDVPEDCLRLCKSCNLDKPIRAFPSYVTRSGETRRGYTCNTCSKRASSLKNSEKIRNRRILKTYGLTPEDYEALKHSQGGVCAICKKTPKDYFVIDHSHKTGRVRGLLCRNCNWGIGHLEDNPLSLLQSIEYLTNIKFSPGSSSYLIGLLESREITNKEELRSKVLSVIGDSEHPKLTRIRSLLVEE